MRYHPIASVEEAEGKMAALKDEARRMRDLVVRVLEAEHESEYPRWKYDAIAALALPTVLTDSEILAALTSLAPGDGTPDSTERTTK